MGFNADLMVILSVLTSIDSDDYSIIHWLVEHWLIVIIHFLFWFNGPIGESLFILVGL